MYTVYHRKSISALRLTAGKVEQQVGLLNIGKLQQGYRTTAIPFVEFHFRPLYFTAAQVANIENFKTELSKYDSERKWKSPVMIQTWETAYLIMSSSGFGKQVCWTKKSVHMQRLIKAVASHGHRLLELHEAGQTEPGSHCLKSLPHDLLPTSSSDRKAILLKSWAVGFSVEWQMWGPLAPDKMDGMFQSDLAKNINKNTSG